MSEPFDKEYWRLQCEVKFVKTRPDLYEMVDCDQCSSSRFGFGVDCNESCPRCHDTGKMQKPLPYPKRPDVPPSLLERLSETYKEWLEENFPPSEKEQGTGI